MPLQRTASQNAVQLTSHVPCQLGYALQDTAVQQLPSWAVALSSCSWTARALEDLVGMTAALYSSSQGLHQQQPLLADRLCQMAASAATSLQHLATAADAPGMRSGAGAALRSACGGMCMRLRDLFMPSLPVAAN
jgi:hypothetical protein